MEYKPARKITNKGNRKNTGFFPSVKNRRPIAYESLIELDYLYFLEYDKNVLSYCEQPFKINYSLNGKPRKYTPDFLVQRVNKTTVVEIKTEKEYQKILKDEKKKLVYVIASKHCTSIDHEFKFITDKDIRFGEVLNNIKYLFPFSRVKVPQNTKTIICNHILLSGPIRITDLIAPLCPNYSDFSKYYISILSLLYFQDIHIDMSKKISIDSIIW